MAAIKVRAKIKKGACVVKALMSHKMETGLRKNKKTGKKIPAHFITEVTATHNGNNVLAAEWGGSVSKNPYLSFKFDGASKGDKLTVSWVDNQGKSATKTAKIK
jgi:sulfur-oxidizing protein SoxZ